MRKHEQTQSLHEVMNALAGRTGKALSAAQDTQKQHVRLYREPGKALSELEAFIQLDPLLSGLHKQYRDAKAKRRRSIEEHGLDSAMTEISADMEDSAWCAMQTRYLELRANRNLMREAQAMMQKSRQYIEEKQKQEKAREAKAFFERWVMLNRLEKQHDRSRVFEWLLLFWWLKFMKPPELLKPVQQRYA